MVAFFLRLYDRFRGHKRRLFALVAALCLLLLAGAFSLGRNENILDFLPFDQTHRKALQLYQQISASDRLFVLFLARDTTQTIEPERITEAIDRFAETVSRLDTLHDIHHLTTRIDYETLFRVSDFLYRHIPYFLTEADYARIDSLLTPDYIDAQIARDRMQLMFPTGSLLTTHLTQDPLQLFTPTIAQLQTFQSGLSYELYDGYIFTPDRKRAIVTLQTPYGSNETRHNARLIHLLEQAASSLQTEFPDVDIHLAGAPVIAVTNAQRIKTDSLWSISIAVVLILALLLYTLRSLRALGLIGVSILFGWLFALGGLSLFRDEVSMIILGIASIIIGIAVNYPLHLLAHLRHEPDVRSSLREIVSPLVIGNITTVGAFLCLVPMTAPALRDLGLFAALMLIGTILFVLIVLPHWVSKPSSSAAPTRQVWLPLSRLSLDNKPWIFGLVCLLTLLFAYFSQQTTFDTNLQHINYMTDMQRADQEAFQRLLGQEGKVPVYVATEGHSWEEALQRREAIQPQLARIIHQDTQAHWQQIGPYLPSQAEQQRRLERWRQFVDQYRPMIHTQMAQALQRNGFRADAFAAFDSLLQRSFSPLPLEDFAPLTESLFQNYLCHDADTYTLIDRIDVRPEQVTPLQTTLHAQLPESYVFDVQNMNSALANALTDDFNYIGWSCGAIVFLFLWFSFGRLELSLLAFLPITVSWLWILGIMEWCGLQFNIVNIILATFIFGQGDDYTIFITEGLIYEYAYGRKLLASYKNSIILSALIMLIGIGTLILSRHPAMHSLAEVTIIGMLTVVTMAYLIPPFIYRWLTRHRDGTPRLFPITLRRLLSSVSFWGTLLLANLWGGCLVVCTANRPKTLRTYLHGLAGWWCRHLIGIRCQADLTLRPERILVARYHSALDLLLLAAYFPGVVIFTDRRLPVLFASLWSITHSRKPLAELTPDVLETYSFIACFADEMPELKSPATPVGIHGSTLLSDRNFLLTEGCISLETSPSRQAPASEWPALLEDKELRMRNQYETTRYFRPSVLARYLYKGPEIEAHARKVLRSYDCFSEWIDHHPMPRQIVIINNGQGEIGLLFALVHRDSEVYAFEQRPDWVALARHTAALPPNLHIHAESEIDPTFFYSARWYLVNPSAEQSTLYRMLNPIEIRPVSARSQNHA